MDLPVHMSSNIVRTSSSICRRLGVDWQVLPVKEYDSVYSAQKTTPVSAGIDAKPHLSNPHM